MTANFYKNVTSCINDLIVQKHANQIMTVLHAFTENDRISMVTTVENVALKIKNSTRLDSGPYVLALENSVGKNQYQLEVVVLGNSSCYAFVKLHITLKLRHGRSEPLFAFKLRLGI